MPDTHLKRCSAIFAVLWTIGMLGWGGSLEPHAIILAVCGALGGHCWYLLMRFFFKMLRTAIRIANDNT
jgi:hypothetical protein